MSYGVSDMSESDGVLKRMIGDREIERSFVEQC